MFLLVRLNSGSGLPGVLWKGELTVAKVRALMTTSAVVLIDLFAGRDDVFEAIRLDKLMVASAGAAFGLAHFPLLQAAQGDVFPEEDVEGGVHVLEHVIADEHDAVESV